MNMLRRSMAIVIPAATLVALGSAPAQAGVGTYCITQEDNCAIFYFNSKAAGSRTAFTGKNGQLGSIPDLAPYKFLTAGNGQGQPVKNNAASFYNGSFQITTVFFHRNYAGACDTFEAHSETDRLQNTYNENASLGFGRSGVNCYKFS